MIFFDWKRWSLVFVLTLLMGRAWADCADFTGHYSCQVFDQSANLEIIVNRAEGKATELNILFPGYEKFFQMTVDGKTHTMNGSNGSADYSAVCKSDTLTLMLFDPYKRKNDQRVVLKKIADGYIDVSVYKRGKKDLFKLRFGYSCQKE